MSMMWVGIGGVVAGAATSIYGANQAADASRRASNQATQAQLGMYYQGRADLAPYRNAGYSALDQIAQLYGLPPPGTADSTGIPGYGQPVNTYGFSTGGGGGSSASRYLPNPSPLAGIGHNPLDMFGGGNNNPAHVYDPASGMIRIEGRSTGDPRRGGYINPTTGEVTVYKPGTHEVDPEASAQATAALRAGNASLGGGDWKRINDAIAQMMSHGYQYTPQAEGAGGAAGGGAAGAPAGRDLSAFYTSPNYQFVRDQSEDMLKNLASAQGGVGGRVLAAAAQRGANLASGEFNTYVDRLFNVAGLGNSSSAASAAAAQNTGGNLAQIYSNAGANRASSYLAGATGVNNAIQGGLQNYAFMNYYSPNRGGYQVPADIQNFQYPFDVARRGG
jgi:hypothetical protein